MKISKERLVQIIKEELENIAKWKRAHGGVACHIAHPHREHEEWEKEGDGVYLEESLEEE
jgi:hypothetical protein